MWANIPRRWEDRVKRDIMLNFKFKRFMKRIHAIMEDQDGSSKLYSFRIRGRIHKYVRVRDSTTGRYHLLRVPPTILTCKEAVAWTFGMAIDEYNPILER